MSVTGIAAINIRNEALRLVAVGSPETLNACLSVCKTSTKEAVHGDAGILRLKSQEVQESLRAARVAADGLVLWEEQDYCQPPLAMERRAVLDDYFSAIQVEKVNRGEGWQQLADLPPLWSDLVAEVL